MTENETKQAKNRAVLVGLNAHCLSAEENADDTSMEELADLLETAGGRVRGHRVPEQGRPRSPHLHRRGQGG